MLLARLEEANRYVDLHPGMAAALAFLRRADLAQLPPGRQEIAGDRIYASVIQAPGRARDAARLEAHRKYLDVQFLLAGTEEMGWKSTPTCQKPQGEYDPVKDFVLFDDTPQTWVAVEPGHLVVFFPEDAHAPMVAEGNLHKIVVKLAV